MTPWYYVLRPLPHISVPLKRGWRFGFVWFGRPDYFFFGFFQVMKP